MPRFRQSTYSHGQRNRDSNHVTRVTGLPPVDRNYQAFAEVEPAVWEWINRNHQTNNFAQNCRDGIARFGAPTDRMIAAVRAAIAREATPATPPSPSYIRPVERITLPGIMAAFNAALASGEVRRPSLRCVVGSEEITLQLASPTSQNPGHVYVKRDGEYCGKITPAGVFLPARDCPADVADVLQQVDKDPLAAAREYARFTAERDGTVGNCCCCGRLLTNPESVRLGIGPICGGRWGWL